MSIANLFVDNSYALKCASLDCKTFNIGDLELDNMTVNNDLTVVGGTRAGNVTVEGELVVTIGNATELRGNVNIGGVTTLDDNLVLNAGKNATVGGNLTVTGTSTFTGDVTANGAFTAAAGANVTGALVVTGQTSSNGLLLTGAGTQSQLGIFFQASGNLVASGCLNGNNFNYYGYRINNMYSVYIEANPAIETTANSQLILTALPPGLRPGAARDAAIDVEFGPAIKNYGYNVKCAIANTGVITIYSDQAGGTFPTGGNETIRLNYPATTYVLISFIH